MVVLKKVVSAAVPASVALAAFLHAHAIGSLVDATLVDATSAPSSIAPFAEARASSGADKSKNDTAQKSADVILNRNPFDHVTGSLRPLEPIDPGSLSSSETAFGDPLTAPPCEGVRAVVAVQSSNADASFAAFIGPNNKRTLQRRGGSIDGVDMRVVYVAQDRVWLTKTAGGSLCQARVFGGASGSVGKEQPGGGGGGGTQPDPQQSPLEKELASKIVKTGPNEFQVDRGAMNMILEAQTELMRTPLLPEKEGDRVVGFRLVKIKPGSVLSTLGLLTNDRLVSINGIEVTSTERMMEAYAKLRSGVIDRLTIHVVRNGKPTNIDYIVR